jgi:hypothetical protein
VLDRLDTPERIQRFLDRVVYSADAFYRSPRRVLRDRLAHCFDGALFAAAALRRLGAPPLLLDLRAVRDDDHVIAVFRRRGRWGAIAKSNFVGLRSREPVYRSLRELAMSYFEDFYNLDGERTLRSYSRPVDLRRFDRLAWEVREDGLDAVANALDDARHEPLISPAAARVLTRLDPRSFRAGMLGIRMAGVYRPSKGRDR